MSSLGRLKWQCRRGCKELDLLLEHYLKHVYSSAQLQEQRLFIELLTLEDNELLPLLMGDYGDYPEPIKQLAVKINPPDLQSFNP
ncbi:hypothetical protein JCM14076_26220 [Methylosoma difficile]